MKDRKTQYTIDGLYDNMETNEGQKDTIDELYDNIETNEGQKDTIHNRWAV